jgi:very-short-patch-repair endonuclease
MELSHLAPEVEPCLRCWGDSLGDDPWLTQSLRAEQIGDSQYEGHFFNNVLRRVSGLAPEHVRLQHEVQGASGTRYRIDFAIIRPGHPRIAIEIDGFQKDTLRNESDPVRQGSMAARQNDLSNADWTFLRFTNRQVITSPGVCRSDIQAALTRSSWPEASARSFAPTERPPSAVTGATRTNPPAVWGWSAEMGKSNGRNSPVRTLAIGAGAVIAGIVTVLVIMQLGPGEEQGSVSPTGSECPSDHPVKGNRSQSGELIYHEPGWRYYEATVPEECFASAGDAESSGYRPSEVRG